MAGYLKLISCVKPIPCSKCAVIDSAFVATAILWLGLGAEFLALALIFVYVGAVMALFLFIVFMLNSFIHLRCEVQCVHEGLLSSCYQYDIYYAGFFSLAI